jgi:LysR family glycine cleavage system transcriptional activator
MGQGQAGEQRSDGPFRHPSLNAVRAFVSAARLGSLKAAAADLGVTAGAVSHHVKQLETEIGKPLFVRRNNSIELTRDGKQLFDAVAPALKTITRASDAVRKQARVVTMNISSSLAQLWLVPRLPAFQARHPRIAIDMETERRPVVLDENLDLAVSYSRSGPPAPGAMRLLTENVLPMATTVFRKSRRGAAEAIEDVPLISSTRDDWEWREWAKANAVDFTRLNIRYRFDIDSPAIFACNASLGVMLMPDWTVNWAAGTVLPFGAYRPQALGAYWLSFDSRMRPSANTFVSWLQQAAGETENEKSRSQQPVPERGTARPEVTRSERNGKQNAS